MTCHKASCLSSCCDEMRDELKNLEQKLINFEKWLNQYREERRRYDKQIESSIDEHDKRLIKLESKNTCENISYCVKKPYKCPICDGFGKAIQFEYGECSSCEGTGIVWG